MNQGQEMFYSFIIERVKPEYEEMAKQLLLDNFAKQENGTFTRETMIQTQTTLMNIVRSEKLEEVKTAMSHFASQFKG